MIDAAPIGHLWPVTLVEGRLRLRPLRRRDQGAWHDLRYRNREWLSRWEATSPDETSVYRSFGHMVSHQARMARAGRAIPLAIEFERRLVGQVGISGILWGSVRSGSIGYWVDQAVAGRGIVPTAVALLTDHALFTCGLNRVEINIRPENAASLRVVEKLGFRDEGLRSRLLHIDGDWRDHRSFALTAGDVPAGGVLERWRASRASDPVPPHA